MAFEKNHRGQSLQPKKQNKARGKVMFLTDEELHTLTGRGYPSAQRRCLDAMGITYRTNALGKVIVLRDHVASVLTNQKLPPINKGVRLDLVR